MDVTPILDQLNDAQRQAVTAPSEPALIIAGAGSGKTRVLLHRAARLIAVEGRLKTSSWEEEGKKRFRTEVVGERITFLGKRDDASAPHLGVDPPGPAPGPPADAMGGIPF